MEYLILALGLLAIMHFLYEGIIAPSYRLELRYKLFKLRDELRMLKITRRAGLPDKHFYYLQDSLNGLIRHIDRIDVTALVALKVKMSTDKEFRQRIEQRAKTLDDCKVEDAKRIRRDAVKLVEHALTANNGAWGFYVVPIAVAWACYEKTKRALRSITALSEPDLDNVARPSPQRRLAA